MNTTLRPTSLSGSAVAGGGMPEKIWRWPRSPASSEEAQQLVGAFDEAAFEHLADAQVEFRKVVDADEAGAIGDCGIWSALGGPAAGTVAAGASFRFPIMASMCLGSVRVNSGAYGLMARDSSGEAMSPPAVAGASRKDSGAAPCAGGTSARPVREQVQPLRAYRRQFGIGAVPFWPVPRASSSMYLLAVGQRHGSSAARSRPCCARRLPRSAAGRRRSAGISPVPATHRRGGRRSACDETGAAAGEVDELADHVVVHARDEIAEVEVEVVRRRRWSWRRSSSAALPAEPGVEVGARHHEGAARFRHLRAVHRQVAIDVQARRRALARAVQHRRPEQAVEGRCPCR